MVYPQALSLSRECGVWLDRGCVCCPKTDQNNSKRETARASTGCSDPVPNIKAPSVLAFTTSIPEYRTIMDAL